jgi:methionyl-tRNA formyltransferase
MGTPKFAVPSLSILHKNGFDIQAVVTAPDSFGGRGGKQLIESEVKKYAIQEGLRLLQPTKLRSQDFIDELLTINADLFVVVAFRMLPQVVWNMPPLGTINLHGSLLPKYRGAAPIHHAVIQGETETGVTIFKLKHEIDTGDVIFQKKMPILDTDTTTDVHDKMMDLGAQALLEAIKMIASGSVEYKIQPEADASHAPKIFHPDCYLDFYNMEAISLYNKIRGLSLYPGAWCKIGGLEYKIYSSQIIDIEGSPGQIIIKNDRLFIHATNGALEILSLKPEGKRTMQTREFLNGHRLTPTFVDLVN